MPQTSPINWLMIFLLLSTILNYMENLLFFMKFSNTKKIFFINMSYNKM